MKIIPLDASHFTDKQSAHTYIAKVLSFPAYYGHNLDALADVLSALHRDVGIIFHAEKYGDYSEPIIDVFCEILGNERILII